MKKIFLIEGKILNMESVYSLLSKRWKKKELYGL